MLVTENTAVSIHYTLTNANGDELDSSIKSEPLVYLHGSGSIISGLENALAGKAAGDKFTVTLQPEEAYGEKIPEMTQVVSKSMFEGMPLEIGMQFHADVNRGSGIITIVEIDGDDVTIDGNHPLAGEALTFEIEVMAIREATPEEIEHNHIHGGNCHH